MMLRGRLGGVFMANAKVKKAPSKNSPKTGADDNSIACAVLCYLLVGIIWYFADEKMRKNSLAGYHAKQAVTLLLVSIIVQIFGWLLIWIPILGWMIHFILNLIILIAWILGIVYAATGKMKPLPIIGKYAEQLKI
jgi:uncharacterized membrane protein